MGVRRCEQGPRLETGEILSVSLLKIDVKLLGKVAAIATPHMV